MRAARAVRAALLLSLLAVPELRAMRAEEASIPMPDGVRLAATLYRPDTASIGERFPALLEYLPYRKDDGTLPDDLAKYPFVVSRGYVCVRVDIRGTGRSEGKPPDREYSEQEQQDAVEVIAWLAAAALVQRQRRHVGHLLGRLQRDSDRDAASARAQGDRAVDAPPRTCSTTTSTSSTGSMHVDEYELAMEIQPAITRSPDYPLDEASLADRFDEPPWFLLYKKQQRDGPFWRRASLSPGRYDTIRCPCS